MSETLPVDSAGVGVHVEVEGPADGPPVLFMHGLGSSSMTWAWLPADVTAGRRVVTLDFRGHGRSGHAAGTYDLARYGADAVAALRATAARPAALVGHSLGGSVGWWVAQRHPELVAGALLEDPPLYADDPRAPEAQAIREVFTAMRADLAAHRAAGRSDADLAAAIAAQRWGPPGTPTFGEIAHADAVAAMAFAHNRVDLGVIDAAIDGTALGGGDTAASVTPAVWVLAADDARGAVFTDEHARRLAASHPEVRVIRVAGSGHGIHDERRHREAFCGHLRRFLDAYAPTA